jgi:hypothetical protein
MAKTIWVNERDVPLWHRLEALARERRTSVSGLLLTAVERYLAEELDTQEAPDSE